MPEDDEGQAGFARNGPAEDDRKSSYDSPPIADVLDCGTTPDALGSGAGTETVQRPAHAEAFDSPESLTAQLAAARAELQRYREVFELAPDAYLITDPNGTIKEANWAAAALLGSSIPKLAGKPLAVFVVPAKRKQFHSQLAKLGQLAILEPWETEFKLKGSSPLPVEIHSGAIRDVDRTLRGFHWIIRDIRRRKETDAKLLQGERLSAIGEMIAGLAHESRNALQRSQACLSMLSMEVQGRPEALSLIERLKTAQQHLSRLYEDVRQYAAPLPPERKPCDLGELLNEVWAELLSANPDRNARVNIVSGECLTRQAAIDRFAISQVFRNILENTLAACADPVEIAVECRDIWLSDGRRALELSISDNGPGFTDEVRERIFDPFFTTKVRGTGLGMAIANRIVKEHEGSIVARNSRHGGAELVITLPRSQS